MLVLVVDVDVEGGADDEVGRWRRRPGKEGKRGRQRLTDYGTLSSLYLFWLDELLDVLCSLNSKYQQIRGLNQTAKKLLNPAAHFIQAKQE